MLEIEVIRPMLLEGLVEIGLPFTLGGISEGRGNVGFNKVRQCYVNQKT